MPAHAKKIFRIHLARRKVQPETFDLATLARDSEGFSGAEIEQAVVSALYEAHATAGPLSTEMVAAELRHTRPLSVTIGERIKLLLNFQFNERKLAAWQTNRK